MYKLQDLKDGEEILVKFYQQELSINMAEGFDDFEMKDKYKDEEEEDDDNETSFMDARENLGSPPLRTMTSHEKSHQKFEQVNIPDIKKEAGGLKRTMTADVKRSYKKIFNIDIAKKNGPISKHLIENTILWRRKSYQDFI